MLCNYLVEWSIELYAENHEDAARQALAIQRDRNSMATIFNVIDISGEEPSPEFESIDLTAIDEETFDESIGN